MSGADYLIIAGAIYIAPHVPKGVALCMGGFLTVIGLMSLWLGAGK